MAQRFPSFTIANVHLEKTTLAGCEMSSRVFQVPQKRFGKQASVEMQTSIQLGSQHLEGGRDVDSPSKSRVARAGIQPLLYITRGQNKLAPRIQSVEPLV